MNHDHNHMEDSLLLLYLTGKANEDDREKVVEWLEKDAGNRKHLDQLENIWLETGKLNPPPLAVNTEKAWERISARIDKQTRKYLENYSERNIITKKYLHYAIRLAAMLIIALGAVAVYWLVMRPAKTMEIVSTISILRDTLPDGSRVALNVESKLTCPQKFSGKSRRVSLQGQAWFGVTHDSTMPFVVQAGNAEIRVLGTEFEIKAYPGTDVMVFVTSGRVMLFHVDENTDDTLFVILGAGDKGVMPLNGMKPEKISEAGPDDLYWLNHTLEFRQTPLSEVFTLLKKYYKVEIRAANNQVLQCRLSATFSEEPIERVLQVIAESFGFEVKVEDHTYVFYGGGC